MTEDEMVKYYHGLNGHEFEQTSLSCHSGRLLIQKVEYQSGVEILMMEY